DILLSEPQVEGEARAVDRLRQRLSSLGVSSQSGVGQALDREMDALAKQADHDGQLEAAIRKSGRVVLPTMFEIVPIPPASPPGPARPRESRRWGVLGTDADGGPSPPLSSTGVGVPIPRLTAATRDLGHVNMVADPDGTTRWEALVLEYRGYYYPSLAVQ